jgi:transposase
VRLVLDEGKSVTPIARELDLVASALGNWVKQTQADRSKGRTGLTTAEREELVRLRKALRIAEEERDSLKKAAAFFAKQSRDEVWLHRGEEGRAPRHDPLPVYARDAERVLRVDATRAVGSAHTDPITANVLARDFTAAAPNQRWVSDTTEFLIGDGAKLYLAAIVDLFSPVALLSARRTKTATNGVVNLSTESDQAQCEETL